MARDRGTVTGCWSGAALLLACSSAAPPSPAPPRAAPPRTAEGPCRFNAPKTSFEEVEVSVPGARFTLGLKDVPSQIELVEADESARLQVQSPLAFSATLPRQQLRLRVAVASDFYGGRLHVGAGLDPIWLGVSGAHLLLSLERSLGLVLDEPLALPCSRVSLRDPMDFWQTPDTTDGNDARAIGMGGESFLVYARPDGSDALRVRFDGPVALVETRPGWWHIRVEWTDGSRLDGWTPERERSSLYKDRGGAGGGMRIRGIKGGIMDGPSLRTARLHAGATVAASPAGPTWARAAHDVEVEVIVGNAHGPKPGRADGWLAMVTVPGLLPPPAGFLYVEHAWVRRGELTLIEPDLGEPDAGGG